VAPVHDIDAPEDVGSGGGVATAGDTFPTSPTAGDQFYRTDRFIVYRYSGTAWVPVSSEGTVTQYIEGGVGSIPAVPAVAATLTVTPDATNGLLFTAVTAGTAANLVNFSLALNGTDTPTPSVSLTANSPNVGDSGIGAVPAELSGACISTWADLAAALNNNASIAALVTVTTVGDGAAVPPYAAVAVAYLANGADEILASEPDPVGDDTNDGFSAAAPKATLASCLGECPDGAVVEVSDASSYATLDVPDGLGRIAKFSTNGVNLIVMRDNTGTHPKGVKWPESPELGDLFVRTDMNILAQRLMLNGAPRWCTVKTFGAVTLYYDSTAEVNGDGSTVDTPISQRNDVNALLRGEINGPIDVYVIGTLEAVAGAHTFQSAYYVSLRGRTGPDESTMQVLPAISTQTGVLVDLAGAVTWPTARTHSLLWTDDGVGGYAFVGAVAEGNATTQVILAPTTGALGGGVTYYIGDPWDSIGLECRRGFGGRWEIDNAKLISFYCEGGANTRFNMHQCVSTDYAWSSAESWGACVDSAITTGVWSGLSGSNTPYIQDNVFVGSVTLDGVTPPYMQSNTFKVGAGPALVVNKSDISLDGTNVFYGGVDTVPVVQVGRWASVTETTARPTFIGVTTEYAVSGADTVNSVYTEFV
jgi:hypothetical protein